MPATSTTPRSKANHTASAATTTVMTIMTRDVVTLRPGTSVEAAAELMLSRGLSRVPVVDDDDHLVGIVSKTDLVEKVHEDADTHEEPARGGKRLEDLQRGFHVHAEGQNVEEIMSRSVMAVGETASIETAAELMVNGHVHGLPVVTLSGTLVGFVSTMDVLGWLCGLR